MDDFLDLLTHCFIVQHSISKNNFAYHRYDPDFKMHYVNIPDLIAEQSSYAISVLRGLIDKIKSEDKAHKMKFQNSLVSLFPETIEYYFQKIDESLSENSPGAKAYGKIHIQLVSSILKSFRSALRERGEYHDDGLVRYVYEEEIEYPLQQLTIFFDEPSQCEVNKKSLLIFSEFLLHKIKVLRDYAEDIDKDYSI